MIPKSEEDRRLSKSFMVEVRDFAMELMKLKEGMKKVKENGIGCVRVERACGEDEVLGFFSLCLLGEFANTDINQSNLFK